MDRSKSCSITADGSQNFTFLFNFSKNLTVFFGHLRRPVGSIITIPIRKFSLLYLVQDLPRSRSWSIASPSAAGSAKRSTATSTRQDEARTEARISRRKLNESDNIVYPSGVAKVKKNTKMNVCLVLPVLLVT